MRLIHIFSAAPYELFSYHETNTTSLFCRGRGHLEGHLSIPIISFFEIEAVFKFESQKAAKTVCLSLTLDLGIAQSLTQ
jgi:hypothetical protein